MKVICDKCGFHFDVVELNIEKVKKDIERNYFRCPNCGEEYTSYYSNDKIRHLIIKQGMLIRSFRPEQSKLHKDQHKIKQLMDDLKKRMEEK